MTSEIEAIKTNEFLRRRKLRLQQVREQSKEIAKKIRQRAKVEKLRQVVDLDSSKQREYFRHQEKLIKKLEQLHARGLENVGSGHKGAIEAKTQEEPEQVDLSKIRGKEAASELRRQKQEKLDEQKKLLDRKLQAREAANEISREKSVVVAHKVAKSLAGKCTENSSNLPHAPYNSEQGSDLHDDVTKDKPTKSDMGTQWDFEEIPHEWEPAVPTLSLPKDDKEDTAINTGKSDQGKRTNLFALSDEMPSSLRGGLPDIPEERPVVKSSLNIVSEYLQNRALRLRETDSTSSRKKQEDLTSIKQTILRTRAAKNEGPRKGEQISQKSSLPESAVTRKSSVTMYNHSTRDTRDIPCNDDRLVVRDSQPDEDAYSQAMRVSEEYNNFKDSHKKSNLLEVRNKVAMSKQNIEKEYRDTMSFLNSLPKDKGNKPVRNAYTNEHQQQVHLEHRQQKMQQEYKKIQNECKKHSCVNTKCRKTRSKSKSPVAASMDDDFNSRDFQYSWMPVPESDGNLAIHTIPTTLKEGKSGNTVTFSKVDSYHEYRSRHKHTPPTKDTGLEKQTKRNVERVYIQNASESDLSSTDTSSVENLQVDTNDTRLDTTDARDGKQSDADRIIIYKILDSKKKKAKTKLSSAAKIITPKPNKSNDMDQTVQVGVKTPQKESRVAFEQINEGVYKTVSEKGDNISSMYFSDSPHEGDNRDYHGPPQCQHCHDSYKAGPSNNNSGMHWEVGNNDPSMSMPGSSIAYTCRCSRKRQATAAVPQQPCPSAATSTSSFKTATTDKANSAVRDGGFIKLIDEVGQEAGKFYIGTTGFLKDDAYEVVIQLRKRDADKGDDKKTQQVSQEEQLVSVKNYIVDQMAEQSAEQIEKKSDVTPKDKRKESGKKSPDIPLPSEVSSEVVINEILTEQESKLPSKTVVANNVEHTKNTKDTGVATSFLDSFAVPDHVTKTEPVPKTATSAYTQTTLNSPRHRPAYYHMSSSTSTAYMSPPEVILPGLFKQQDELADDEMYDSIEKIDEHDNKRPRCNNVNCTCKNCIHGRKDKMVKLLRAKLSTPPNTDRDSNPIKNHVHKHDRPSNTHGYSKRCHKCGNCTKSKMCLKIHKHRQCAASSKRSSRNLVMRVNSSAVSSYKSKNTSNRSTAAKINPYVKDYVDKLLALNRESLRAIDVVDQECSSVATPGSSIINVPQNIDKSKPLENKISLEQIKNIVKQQIFNDHYSKQPLNKHNHPNTRLALVRRNNTAPRLTKRKQIHKVKSLNISKQLFKQNHPTQDVNEKKQRKFVSASETQEKITPEPTAVRPRSKSSPTPRRDSNSDANYKTTASDNVKANVAKANVVNGGNKYQFENKHTRFSTNKPAHRHTYPITEKHSEHYRRKTPSPLLSSRATVTPPSMDSDTEGSKKGRSLPDIPMDTSTQTSGHVDPDINYMKLAENKLQNMEKIADLTEKCTKRLSNLAKVLEEVRKNKSLAYSQISSSDSASDVEQKSDKNATEYKSPIQFYDQIFDTQKRLDIKSPEAMYPKEIVEPPADFIPILTDIPKPDSFKIPNEVFTPPNKNTEKSNVPHSPVENMTKNRPKPPPALSRISLKHGHEYIIPHELSTVIEVDSPMSMKIKNQSTGNYTNGDTDRRSNDNQETRNKAELDKVTTALQISQDDPDLLQSNTEQRKNLSTILSESSDDSKLQMMDLKQFNDIMLKPFLSIHEYAKQRDIGSVDEGSNLEDIPRNDGDNDDISSLHSDGSLPDVIAELLKRNIISEPFKFETTSNVNSTTVSSESTLSVLALSKIRKDKKKSNVKFSNKENVTETSDTLSISSNPDLEHAFKKLGMGWASSTLKKTKERLALSSSSNTSSSSMSHFKIRSFNQDVPVLVTDSISSALNMSKREAVRKVMDTSKNAEQQTSMTNSMTVKEFLTNELAKKITFTNKSNRSTTEEEFVSLYETRMPEQMKHSSQMIREERSIDSVPSGTNNRARTSTPVQLFKSMTYRSSSSSNVSNGLFSNADDLSSVKGTSNSVKNQTTSDKDDLTVPNISLRLKGLSDCSKSE